MRILVLIVLCVAASMTSARGSLRSQMDQDRQYVDLESEEAYEISQKFLKMDSAYYLGWLYLGAYLHQRAADITGYAKCVKPILKAKKLMEKDYADVLKQRVNNEGAFFENFYRYQDYNYIAYYLRWSYAVMSRPDSAYWVADEYQKFDFQKDLAYFNGPYLSKAWTVYRNRTKTSEDYPFLQANLEENMALIHRLMDSAHQRISRNIDFNNRFLPYFGNDADMSSYYHFESIVYAYEKEYEKAEKAYSEMEEFGLFSHNNYALLKMSEGSFEQSYANFDFVKKVEPYEKVLEEWIYYQSMLNTYSNQNKESIELVTNWIKKVGSTPGYGWYNIALARSLMYQGDLEQASIILQKAKLFTEYHIGTTLGQESYEQAIEFLDVMLASYKIEALKFENPRWFFSLKQIGRFIRQRWKLLIKRWKLLNKIAGYSDREKVVYDLFSGESTMGWYDILFTIKNYSTSYFTRYYQKLLQDKSTPLELVPYYQFALSTIYQEAGQRGDARAHWRQASAAIEEGSIYATLLHFLLLEEQVKLGLADNNEVVNDMYTIYPTLLPYTGRTMQFRLKVVGESSQMVEDCIARMKKCRIDFVDVEDESIPTVTISPLTQGTDQFLVVEVSKYGSKMMDNYKFQITNRDDGIKLAYSLFDIYGRNKTENEF